MKPYREALVLFWSLKVWGTNHHFITFCSLINLIQKWLYMAFSAMAWLTRWWLAKGWTQSRRSFPTLWSYQFILQIRSCHHTFWAKGILPLKPPKQSSSSCNWEDILERIVVSDASEKLSHSFSFQCHSQGKPRTLNPPVSGCWVWSNLSSTYVFYQKNGFILVFYSNIFIH